MKIYPIFILIFSFFFTFIYFSSPSVIYAFSLDSVFGTNGKNITSFGQDSLPSDLILEPDNELIVVGRASNGSNFDWAITKYTLNGLLDINFGNNGKILSNFGADDSIQTVKIQTDGKIVVGGFSQPTGNYLWTLGRYNANGTIDNSFGTNGIVTTSFSSNLSLINNLNLQSDGKIIAIGYVNKGTDDVAITRYNSDGSLDSNFGIGGIVTTPIGGGNDRGTAGLLQPDGKIVVFGDYDAGGDHVFLLRYNSDGTPDNTFGVGGKVTTQIGNHDGARDIVLQPDGKIVITGGTNNPTPKTYLARYNSDGTLDGSFGVGGKVITSFATNNTANTSLLLQDGKIVVGGYQNANGTADFALHRFNTDGSLDTSFGTNGSLITPIGSQTDEIRSIALQNDGKIVAAGNVSNGSYSDWGIARFAEEDTSLPVPLLKQTSSPWESHIYDTANLWNPTNPTINRWGCALTSAVMILQFHGIKKMPDGTTDLDPGTLNTWLKTQADGYIGNGLVNWLAISRFSKLARGVNNVTAYDALEYTRIDHPIATNHAQLAADLNSGIPDILEVPGHFIVATGITANSFSINDPFYDHTDLQPYGNNYAVINQFKPSFTNLSYIMIVLDTNIQGFLKAPSSNNPVGQNFIQNPITNPVQPSQNNGPAKRIIILPKPTEERYTLILSSTQSSTYSAQIFLYDKDGNVVQKTEQGVLGSNNTDSIAIQFNENGNNTTYIKRGVSFQSTIDDIAALRTLGQIKKEKLKTDLITLMQKAEKIVTAKKFKKNELKQKFDDFREDIKKNRKKDMTEQAYQILLYDLEFLKELYLSP